MVGRSTAARFVAQAVAVFAWAAAPTTGQQPTTLQGVVADEVTGLVIPAATVTIVGTTMETATTPDGLFSFRAVSPGRLSLRVRAPGYATVVEVVDLMPGAALFAPIELPSMVVMLQGLTAVAPSSQSKRRYART